jgi:hypothetical protein
MDKKTFIELVKDGALEAYKKYNILPSLTIAQAILESSWGKQAKGFNLFGIKWTSKCGFEYQLLWTREYINGKFEKVRSKFRKYKSYSESVDDHAKFLLSKRYASVRQAQDYKQACIEIQRCGYASDPGYSEKLMRIIEQNKLNVYDGEQQKNEVIVKRVLKLSSPMMRGEDVQELQKRLNRWGSKLVADGIFGKLTHGAVVGYQKQKGLVQNGIVDEKMWDILFR